jgi:hypothetical protein
LEEKGLVTVALSLIREHTEKVKPPRAVYVPFPLGLPVGHPGNVPEQQAVLDLAFSTLDAVSVPVLLDYRDDTAAEEGGSPLQASEIDPNEQARAANFATEVTLMRRYWEQHLAATGRTGVGLSKVPPQRFRGVVRFLEALLTDQTADSDERPTDMPKPMFIRTSLEDLRVMYSEARLQTHPHESSQDRQRWLLGSTALGLMLRRLRDTFDASDDPQLKALAFGIAR